MVNAVQVLGENAFKRSNDAKRQPLVDGEIGTKHLRELKIAVRNGQVVL
jgi:hypothetical protein